MSSVRHILTHIVIMKTKRPFLKDEKNAEAQWLIQILSLFCQQVYVKGDLIGGLDIVKELQSSGELMGALKGE